MFFLKHVLIVFLYSVSIFLFGKYIHFMNVLELFTSYISKDFNTLESSYDYIIVGCGSAGSTIALRLAEDKNVSVLVLEAGTYGNKWYDIPAIGSLLQLSSNDWQYETVPQKNALKAMNNRVSKWPMGRIVGGSGRLNYMVYARGHPDDFKDWYKDVDYDYKLDVLNYFKKAEHQKGLYSDDTEYHGSNGHLVVDDLHYTTSLSSTFLKAVQILGYPVTDLNGRYNKGFMQPQVTIHKGARWTPAHQLRKLKKSNIDLQINTLTYKILFKSNYESYGVEYFHFGKKQRVFARKGIIISSGVIGSPKLLMHSGIGPIKHLTKIGIRPILNLPVGNNLQDHIATGTGLVLLNVSLGINVFSLFSPYTVFEYLFLSKGPWTSPICEILGAICTNSNNTQPDLGFMVLPVSVSSDGGIHMRKASGLSALVWEKYFKLLVGKTTISILPILLHPKSKGTVRLLNKDPHSSPIINPNYLADPYDVDILIKGIEIIKQIIKTEPMQQIGAKLNQQRFPGCEHLKFDTRPYWECYVKHLTLTAYHPTGTCKMGGINDKEAVVDFDFRVRGTNKLFVVDSSVIPSSLSYNPNAAVIMLAEKAADRIKYIDFLNSGSCDNWEVFIPERVCLRNTNN